MKTLTFFRRCFPCLLALGGLIFSTVALVFAEEGADKQEPAVLFALDFTSFVPDMTVTDWLKANHFELHRHADDARRIEFEHRDDQLHVIVKRPSFGLAVRPLEVPAANTLRLHWGVSDYPDGASYEDGIDNEAILVYVFFGNEKLPSGEMLIPDSPYFIGFFLCPPSGDQVEQPYVGHHYEKTGRYICVDHPGEGAGVVSEIDLDAEFLKGFGVDAMPPVSGFSIEIDTRDSANDGHAAAFIERLEFLE